MAFRSGFVNIIGNPNVGKSTLLNELVGEKLSIITSKAQTTRHRILGIVNGEEFQIIFSMLWGGYRQAIIVPDHLLRYAGYCEARIQASRFHDEVCQDCHYRR